MQLITTNKALENALSRLVKTYANVVFAVAWATANTSVFRQLTAQPLRIREQSLVRTSIKPTLMCLMRLQGRI
jgi:hypothetical protein